MMTVIYTTVIGFYTVKALLKDLSTTCVISFPMQTKKCTFILIFMLKRQITPKKLKKSMSILQSHDQWQSLENICHSFLLLHCRRMPRECKYWKLDTVHMTLQINFSSFPDFPFFRHLSMDLFDLRNTLYTLACELVFREETCKFALIHTGMWHYKSVNWLNSKNCIGIDHWC